MKKENKELHPSDVQTAQNSGKNINVIFQALPYQLTHDGKIIETITGKTGLYYLNAGKIVYSFREAGNIKVRAAFTNEFTLI